MLKYIVTKQLAIITTHPIQYNAPLFKYLAAQELFNIKVFYTWSQASRIVHDKDFGIDREWDINLLNGYDYTFVDNISTKPGSHHYKGIINPSLIEEVEQFKPDAILIYGWKFQSHFKLMRHFHSKVTILFRGDSTLLDEHLGFSLKKFLRFNFLKWVYSHVDIALSPGKASDEYFTACGLKKKQIICAPHTVDNDFFSSDNEQKEQAAKEWRQQLGIPDEHKVFLFAGKLEPKKDPELLINAFSKLLQKRQDIHLIIVGSGILESKLKALVSSISIPISTNITQPITDLRQLTTDKTKLTSHILRLMSHVYFLPFQNQSLMPIVYRLADVFVLPSKGPGETWGLAVNEAMASGRPVILSNKCGSASELIEEGINGYIFEAGNESSLLQSMENMLEQDLSLMGNASKSKIDHFNYHTFFEALNKVAFNSLNPKP